MKLKIVVRELNAVDQKIENMYLKNMCLDKTIIH